MESEEKKPGAAVADAPLPVIDPSPLEPSQQMGSTGSVIAILLIVFLLVVGAFYVWGQRLTERNAEVLVPAVAE